MEALAAQNLEDIPASDPDVITFIRRPDTCLSAMIARALSAYRGRDALAWRPTLNGVLSSQFELMSYDELERRVWALASTLRNDPQIAMKVGQPVGIMAFANVDFVTLNFALGLNGMVIAPLQTTASMEALTGLCEDLNAPCLATSLEHLDQVVSLASASPETRCILVFDHDGLDATATSSIEAARARLATEKPNCIVLPFSEAISRGEALPRIEPFMPDDLNETLALIYYTSGSTGTPKGVMYSEKMVKSAWAMAGESSQVVLHYQPLNHSFGMSFIATVTAGGGTTYFTAKSDLSTLLDDMKIVRPTLMAWVPRICELLYQRYHADYGNLIKTDEQEALRRFKKEVLGGRMLNALGGSAPTSDDLQAFVEKVNGRKLYNGYGCTEAGGVIWVDNVVQRPPVIDYKLVDVPDLGYFKTDKPYPRGELAIKSETLFKGYFARPDLTAKPFNNLDRLLLRLRTSNRPEDTKLQLKLYQEALEADYAWREDAVRELAVFKEHWGPIFTRCRLLRQKLPEIYPDPEDVVILSPTEFRFLGPITAEEAACWETFIRGRKAFLSYADEIIEGAGLFRSLEEDRQRYLKVRRHFYRANRSLPKAFKKKHPVRFPSFKPPSEPPAWFFEDDE